jgi:hypothetical protein
LETHPPLYGRDSVRYVGKTPSPLPLEAMPRPGEQVSWNLRIAGWPRECIWGAIARSERRVASQGRSQGSIVDDHAPIRAIWVGRPFDVGDARGIGGYVPIGPIWSGLALNTLFYGTIAWALLFLPGTFHRWRRQRAGRCLKCGYDRAGLSPEAACSECGGR